MPQQYAFRDFLNHQLIICLCGNNPKESYFKRCRRDGGTAQRRGARRFYGCIECGRIINSRTLEIVGKNRRLIIIKGIEEQNLDSMRFEKPVSYWPVNNTVSLVRNDGTKIELGLASND